MTPKFVVLPLIVFLFPMETLGETMDNLIKRNDLFYPKFSDVPFTGTITGKSQGKIKNGKRDGPWVRYYINGQLWVKKTYKDGKLVEQ